MTDQWASLARAATEVATRLPSNAIQQFAEGLLKQSQFSGVNLAHHIGDLWNSEFRKVCYNFLHTRQTEFPDLTIEALVGALLSTSYMTSLHQQDPQIELAWTGPDVSTSPLRQTEQAILELIDAAAESLILVSFAVYRIPRIRSALVEAATRGVKVTLIVETPDRIEGEGEYDTLKALGKSVLACCNIYYWPKAKRAIDASGRAGLLHIKCIVQDQAAVFLSSANFTEYAFTMNMELGILVRSPSTASQIKSHLDSLIKQGILERIEK